MSIWTLTFRPEGDGPPEEIRIRRLLKTALRHHRLRCIDFACAEHPPIPRPPGGICLRPDEQKSGDRAFQNEGRCDVFARTKCDTMSNRLFPQND